MKILFITAEGFDTPNPNNQMAETMLRGFLDSGHKVHLVQSHRKGINPDIPDSIFGRDGFTCDTIVRKVVDKTNFVRRYLNDTHYAFQAMRCWTKINDADVIYLQSNPTIIYPMLLLKLFKRNIPIVYSIYDVFPGHAYDIGVITNKFIFGTLKLLQKPCYKLADAIIVLSDDMKEKIIEQGADGDRIHIVPAWYDVKDIREIPWDDNRFVKKYGIEFGKFYVQFAGTIGYVLDYKTIIELAKRLKDKKNIVIQIVGDGNVKKQFVHEVEGLKLDNIKFYPLQTVDMVSDVYSACDVCLIPLKKGVIGNGVPSKTAILMACKRVIVTSVEASSKYAKMFFEKNMGIAVDVGNYDDLANAIVELSNNPKKIRDMANNAYLFGKENYSSDSSIRKLLDVLNAITTK